MRTSRSVFDLQPHVEVKARGLLDECKAEKIDLIITCTFRDNEAQQALYEQGRTKPGPIVTKAKPGESAHNYGLAFDVVPLRNGKPVWGRTSDADKQLWERIGQIGESLGLEWAGRWKNFPEYAHFQMLGGKTIEQIAKERGM